MRILGIIVCLLCFPVLLVLLLVALVSDDKNALAKLTPEEREKELWRMR